MANPIKKRRDGFNTVNPYLVVSSAEKVLAFMKEAFDATQVGEIFRAPDGRVAHATARVGDSMVEIGEGPEPMPMNLHMYIDDVDGTYRRAIAAGAESIREPETTFYGERSAGVKDPGGNRWWLACHVEDVSSEEIMRRAKAHRE